MQCGAMAGSSGVKMASSVVKMMIHQLSVVANYVDRLQ
jgi:hypothetical protein